jgi:allantoin racemase
MHIRILEAFVIPEAALQDLLRQLQDRYGRDGLTLSVAAPTRPPELEAHESLTALSFAVPELVRNALQAEADGVDGIMVDCMADPGVEVLRETVSIPVLGPGHTSMHVAAMLGRRFSLLVTTDFSSRYFLEYARSAGLDSVLASCRTVDIPPEEIQTDSEGTFKALANAAKEAIVNDGADTLILCCTGFAPFSARLKQKLAFMKLSVPLIDPFAVTINTLDMLINSGLSQSKIAYPDTGIGAQHRDKRLAGA